jgi:hypothetical protein
MVDKSCRTGNKLAVHFEGFTTKAFVFGLGIVEFVQGKEIQVLSILGILTTAVGFLCSDDLADVLINELPLPNVLSGAYSCEIC